MYDSGVQVDLCDLPARVPVEAWEEELGQSVWDDVVEALVAEVEAEPVAQPGSSTARRDELATWSRDELLAEMSAAELESRSAQARVLAAVGELASRPARDEFTAVHVALAVGGASTSGLRRVNEALVGRGGYPVGPAGVGGGGGGEGPRGP